MTTENPDPDSPRKPLEDGRQGDDGSGRPTLECRSRDVSRGLTPLQQFSLGVLGTAGAGLGGLGVVVAVGGVITEARFRSAGLPTELSTSLQSRSYLLAVGGETLAVVALVALVLLGIVHTWPAAGLRQAGPVIALGWLAEFTGFRSLLHRIRCLLRRLAAKARLSRFGAWLCRRMQERARKSGPPPPRWTGWTWFFAAFVVLSIVDYLFWAEREISDGSQPLLLLAMVIVAIAGAMVATSLARQARELRTRASRGPEAVRLLGLFATVTVIGGLAAAGGSLANPRVRPAAVLLDHPARVVGGIYVGQTADYLYLGEAVQQAAAKDLGDHTQGRLVEFRRADVLRMVVGASQPLDKALDSEPQVCALLVASSSPARHPVDMERCDTIPPAPPHIARAHTNPDRSVTLSLCATGASHVTIVVDGAQELSRPAAGKETVLTSKVLTDGTHTATATATDIAGNTSATSSTIFTVPEKDADATMPAC